MDPCELRLKNFLDEKSLTVGQYRITSNGSVESLKAVMERSKWGEKYKKLPEGHASKFKLLPNASTQFSKPLLSRMGLNHFFSH